MWRIYDKQTYCSHLMAEIDVVIADGELFGVSRDCAVRGSSNHHASPGNRRIVAHAARAHKVTAIISAEAFPTPHVIRPTPIQDHARMLDLVVWVEKFHADHADVI